MSNSNSNSNSNTSSSSSTFQSFSTSYSSSTSGNKTHSHQETTYSDPSGTRVHTRTQNPGEQPREERYEIDAQGRKLEEGGNAKGRIQDVTDEDKDREYEERMEEEYAKREGGA